MKRRRHEKRENKTSAAESNNISTESMDDSEVNNGEKMNTTAYDPENPAQQDEQYDPTDHITQLEQERDDAVDKWKRALADFRNFQQRSLQNEKQAKEQAIASVARSLLPVLDHFDLALNQDFSQTTLEQFVQGMKIVNDELHKALNLHGVKVIEVEVGDRFDPNVHEAVAHVPADNVDPGHISNVTQPGYRIGDRVLRAVKVTVAPPDSADTEEEESIEEQEIS